MKIKDLLKVDRPREKLEKYGPERLSNSEFLAILLRTGSEGVNVGFFARVVFILDETFQLLALLLV